MSLRLHRDEAPGLHRIEDGYTNWYLIQDGTRLTVVDTGHPASWRSLHQALNALGRSPGDIEAVVLTHAHFDHMGFAQRARLDLGVDLWAHELEVAVVAHPWRFDHERSRALYARYPRFLVIFTSMAANGALGVRGATDVLTYTPGAELDVPGRPRVVFTPGHTHGTARCISPTGGRSSPATPLSLSIPTPAVEVPDRGRRGDRRQSSGPGLAGRPRRPGRRHRAHRTRGGVAGEPGRGGGPGPGGRALLAGGQRARRWGRSGGLAWREAQAAGLARWRSAPRPGCRSRWLRPGSPRPSQPG